MASKAQIAANKSNAQKSTGPKSLEGKQRSSKNALIHGLNAKDVVMPWENPEEFAAELAQWNHDFQPQSAAAAALVERAASAAWRCRRCVKLETERFAMHVGILRQNRMTRDKNEAIDNLELLADNPRLALAKIEATRVGLMELHRLWGEMAQLAETAKSWVSTDFNHELMMNLLGCLGTDNPEYAGDLGILSIKVMTNNYEPSPGDREISDVNRPAWILRRFQSLIADRVRFYADWIRDKPNPEDDYYQFARIEMIDDSKETQNLLRQETRYDRMMRGAITSLIQLQKTGVDKAGIAAEEDVRNEAIGSKSKDDKGFDSKKAEKVKVEPVATDSHAESYADATVPMKSDRDRSGRNWGVDEPETGPLAS